MKTLTLIVSIFILCVPARANAQDANKAAKPTRVIFITYIPTNDDTISWNANRPLTADDFIAIPLDVEQAFAALSTKGIIAKGRMEEREDSNIITATTATIFVKHASWLSKALRKAKDRGARVLSIEQLQLDIAKLYEEKMKRYILAQHFERSTFSNDFNKIYLDFRQQSADEMIRMKNDCMLIEAANKKERDKNLAAWQSKIATELKAMLDSPL